MMRLHHLSSLARFSISSPSFKPHFFSDSSRAPAPPPLNFASRSSLTADHHQTLGLPVNGDKSAGDLEVLQTKIEGPPVNGDESADDLEVLQTKIEGLPVNCDKSANDLEVLQTKIEAAGIKCETLKPGFYDYLICPECNGGKLMERTLSFYVSKTRNFSMWRCFHADCEWAGQAFTDSYQPTPILDWASDFNSMKTGSMSLEPLGQKLIAFFAERMISKETLHRNSVMQVSGDQDAMAFCYRQNGMLVGCKYRRIDKRFWQEKGTQRIFYGVDDIQEASEVIIVEGEMDKLSIEEVGFLNCVSVPGGAPQKVSKKELPPEEKDVAYQYVWNCKGYLDKVSRIILATDSDAPGQALAEELARRLGKERCWRVFWPQREGSDRFNDANEVLMNLGPDAVRKAIESAVLFDAGIELKQED